MHKSIKMLSVPAIFVSKGLDGFNVLRRKLIYSFLRRGHTYENPQIQALVQGHTVKDSAANREQTKVPYK